MNAVEVMELSRSGLWVLIKIVSPIMAVAMSVGLGISLIQALTQIQEMTLSFVPKIIAIFFSLIALMPFITTKMTDFADEISERIVTIEQSETP